MPAEVHEHFDVDGNLTGSTVVHRQSEWDDETRARAVALVEWESNLCGCGCGRPIVETANPDQAYLVHKYVCMADKAIHKVRRDARVEHEKKGAPEGWDDGIHYYAEPTELTEEQKTGVKRVR